MNKKQVIRDLIPDALATESVMVLMEQVWDKGKREGKVEALQEKVSLIKDFLTQLDTLKNSWGDEVIENIELIEELYLLKLDNIDATSV
jgi:hypothetical protein